MRSTCAVLIILAFAYFSYAETKPDETDSVDIIKKFAQDFRSSPSGHIFNYRSGTLRPLKYDDNINKGKTKIVGQLEMKKLAEINDDNKIGTYRVAGGYGFTISHDYGGQNSHVHSIPLAAPYSGTSNADLPSITVLQLGGDGSDSRYDGPSIDVDEKSESVETVKNEGLDGYLQKEIYEPYMEYDKLVKDSKKASSIYPGEYYELDVHDGKEKYESEDGYGESNNGDDGGRRYRESEKYYEPQDYINRNGDHGAALRRSDDYVDDGEIENYVIPGEYNNHLEQYGVEEKNRLEDGHDDSEYNYEHFYEPYKSDERLTDFYEHHEGPSNSDYSSGYYKRNPEYENMRNSFLDDFFKEYNQFSKGANIKAGYNYDHGYDHGFHGDHDDKEEFGRYGEDGGSEKEFFDESDLKGHHHEEGGGVEDAIFGEKKGHKKGSKTTGYRNVLHKDEYTKDHKFYEHAKQNGHFNKDGDYGEHEHRHEESREKGGHHDSSSYDDHHGKSDDEDKGHDFYDDVGHDYEDGHKSHFGDHSDYSHDEDSRDGSEYGESHED